MRQGANFDFGGRVRRIGYLHRVRVSTDKSGRNELASLTLINVKQSVGAATLLLSQKSAKCEGMRKDGLDIPYPHAGKTRDAHERKQDRARTGPRETEHPGDQHPVNVGLAQSGCDGEPADEQHNRRGEHHGEYPSARKENHELYRMMTNGYNSLGGIRSGQSLAVPIAHDAKCDEEERDEYGGHEERDGLRRPHYRRKHEYRQTPIRLLLWGTPRLHFRGPRSVGAGDHYQWAMSCEVHSVVRKCIKIVPSRLLIRRRTQCTSL